MIGQKFNYLTVLSKNEKEPRYSYYLCQCECGTVKSIRKDGLISGNIKSCGCKRIGLLREQHLISINESFFTEPSADRDYFLGLFITDGYISSSRQIGIQLQEKDKHILEYFHQKICPNHKLQCISKSRKDGINRQNQYRLLFSNDNIYDLLTSWGFDNNKSVTARVPEFLKYNNDFWRGCIDGDGAVIVSKNRIIVELIGTLDVISSFKDYCEHIGVKTKSSILQLKRYTIDLRTFRISGKQVQLIFDSFYNSNPSAYLVRKRQKYVDWFQFNNVEMTP